MIWSLLKILSFVAAIAAVSLFASFIAESGSDVRLVIADYEISTSSFTFAVLLILLFPSFWLIFFLVGLTKATVDFFLGDETALTRYFNRNRQKRGYEALADGLLALSSGEPKLAMAKAKRAENLLRRPEITNIIIAQAAERSGDKAKAVFTYKGMLKNPSTRFAGITGLLRHKLEDGDTTTALKLAERAFLINPNHDELQNTLLRLQSSEEDWEGARRTLAAKLKYRKIPRDVYRRRNAILTLTDAQNKIARGEGGEIEAIAANRESPSLVPAAVLAAEVKSRVGDKKTAEGILRKAWLILQHPDLAATFASLEPDESPGERRRRFEKFLGKSRSQSESRMLMAELCIADSDYAAARQEIGNLPTEQPTVRSLAIMAAVERGEGRSDAVVRGWLAKAVSASRGPQWNCEICRRHHAEWVPICESCGGFDTLAWSESAEKEELPESHAGLLTLVASEIESRADGKETDHVENDIIQSR